MWSERGERNAFFLCFNPRNGNFAPHFFPECLQTLCLEQILSLRECLLSAVSGMTTDQNTDTRHQSTLHYDKYTETAVAAAAESALFNAGFLCIILISRQVYGYKTRIIFSEE